MSQTKSCSTAGVCCFLLETEVLLIKEHSLHRRIETWHPVLCFSKAKPELGFTYTHWTFENYSAWTRMRMGENT